MKLKPLLLLLAALAPGLAPAQTTVKKVVLQGFWWDYRNNSFPAKWADYLTELAPRLKGLGIDAVWIPPTPKNNGGTNGVGYAPFDAYDLGDKFQKGTVRTRVGTKDELLRLVAVLHTNGIEVIQDVVLNHVDGAGTSNGAGGQDPNSFSMSANGGFKNFRYAGFGTPLPEGADNAAAYLARAGRWPKNYANFHAHAGHNSTSGDLAQPAFGPDFCYGDDGGADGYGPSTNATFNPAQPAGYSRTQARNWVLWMKKQTGIDGIRWDAVKNYGYAPQQDLAYNLKYLNGSASGGETMLNEGEFVGSKAELDTYVAAVNGRNGGTDFLMGTFDFSLRGAIYGMVTGGGAYDLGQIPGAQQNQRVAYYAGSNTYVHRTAPFVNSHDTFRPQLNAQGNYTGWNTGDELAAHIEPGDVRLSAAYAITFAVDGNPHVFIEDLFNLGYAGQRFTHLPADRAALAVRPDLANLLWCHQHLHFKDGAYFVRAQSADHLVIERGNRALIGINDQFTTWQNTTVSSNFAPGTVLKDYSGANGTATRTVGAGGSVSISTPPCNGTAGQGRRGYAVWAPVGQDGSSYAPGRPARTTQEWELADDLGDANCRSLGQGGRLPDNSRSQRVAGKIFAQAGQPVEYVVYAESAATSGRGLVIGLYDQLGAALGTTTTGVAASYTPAAPGWLTLKVRNATATQLGQRAFAQVTYQSPDSVATRAAQNVTRPAVAIWNATAGTADTDNCRNWEAGIVPDGETDVRIPGDVLPQPVVNAGQYLVARRLTLDAGATLTTQPGSFVQLFNDLTNNGTLAGPGTWLLQGLARIPQRLGGSGPLTFSKLTIQNDSATVALDAPLTVRDTLTLLRGRLALGAFNLNLGAARVLGGSADSYVLTLNTPGPAGTCIRDHVGGPVLYPVGTPDGYAPFTYTGPAGAYTAPGVRVFEGMLTDGRSGPPYANVARFVNRTWASSFVNAPGPGPGQVEIGWEAAAENAGFQRNQSALYQHYAFSAGPWTRVSPAVAAAGTGPYRAAFAGGLFGYDFAVGNFTALAARAATEPQLVEIAPNPTAGSVRLRAVGTTGPVSLALTSVLGQTVLAETTGPLAAVEARLNAALAPAAPGVYVVTVRAGGRTQHLRLVRE